MLSNFSYPIICTDSFVQTLAFYEDYFDYLPAFEMDGFAILKRADRQDAYLAVMDAQNKALPKQYQKPVQGMILNYPVADVEAAHQKIYMDGLNVLDDPKPALCGRKHFFVEDPNGILIDIAEDIDLDALINDENAESFHVMACA